MEKSNRTYAVILTVLFSLFLCFPMVYDALDSSGQKEVSESENRNLAAKPLLDVTYLDNFPDQYTAYFNDHFPFREGIMNFFGKNILYRIFGKSPVPDKVTIGKDGWLFQADNRPIFSGQKNFTSEEVETIYRKLLDRALYLDSLGIEFYFMITPMKCEVYPEKLPHFFVRTPDKTRTDKLIERISGDTLIHLIQLKEALSRVGDSLNVYHKTDHHWSTAGGFVVYKEIMRHISESNPGMRAIHDTDIFPIIDSSWCGGLATMINLRDEFKEIKLHYVVKHPTAWRVSEKKYTPPYWFAYPDEYEIRTANSDTALPTIVIIRDSFFNTAIPFLAEDFQKTVSIFDAWMFGTNYDIIKQEGADIVLLEVYEPLLDHLLVSN